MTKLKGIDVSKHQGKIDWDKAKKDGIQFAMLRMGFGGDIKSQDDSTFERNVKECERVGIPWGAYLYSYAMNISDAKSEVRHALRLLKGKNPKFPIAFDMEDADGYKKNRGMPSNSQLVDICYTFLDEVEKAGYYVSLYASLSWLNNQLKSSKLDRFDKWVAHWTTANKSSYSGLHRMWQYTDKGKVNGISGNVDMNIAYSDFVFGKKKEEPKKTETTPKTTTKNYKIKSGDILGRIAQKHNTNIATLMKLNPSIKNPDIIYVGQTIKVPK